LGKKIISVDGKVEGGEQGYVVLRKGGKRNVHDGFGHCFFGKRGFAMRGRGLKPLKGSQGRENAILQDSTKDLKPSKTIKLPYVGKTGSRQLLEDRSWGGENWK